MVLNDFVCVSYVFHGFHAFFSESSLFRLNFLVSMAYIVSLHCLLLVLHRVDSLLIGFYGAMQGITALYVVLPGSTFAK